MKTLTANALTRLQKVECPDTVFCTDHFPIILKKGRGMWVYDIDHRRYLDFTACFGVLALGHRPAVTLHALRKQAAQLIHGMGDVHPSLPKIQLLEMLAQISPYANPKSMLGLSGGDAVEAALKTALLATKRTLFLSFSGAYHGLQNAPLSLNDRPFFTNGFEHWIKDRGVILPFPYFPSHISSEKLDTSFLEEVHQLYQPDFVLNRLEEELKKMDYAGLILEPIQGRGGKRSFSAEFLQQCQYLCKKYGTLLIFDEIYTGLGRTGKMFALEHFNVIPDLLCVGKALGGGLPLSACIGEILDVWTPSCGEARHTQTFLGHPLACAVAYATLKEIKKNLPEFQKELIKIDGVFHSFLRRSQESGFSERFPFEIRGQGFMRGLWFYTQKENFCADLMEKLLLKGVLVLPEGPRGDVLALTPPLIAKAEDFERVLKLIDF